MFYSPFRYPGGKSKLANLIAKICLHNNLRQHFVEPYAGGASVALYLLMKQKVAKITINDYDRSIYAFWHAVLYETESLCNLIKNTDINISNWEKAKKIQENKNKADFLSLGFSTLFLNRTNRSGLIQAGPIGGKNQNGKYKIDCRFNKLAIIKRILSIAQYKNVINVSNKDALTLIQQYDQPRTIFYLDPPYYFQGHTLYAHYYTPQDHKKLSTTISNMKYAHWILSYDNVKAIKEIYHWVRPDQQKKYSLYYRVSTKKQGHEILFFSDNIDISSITHEQLLLSNPIIEPIHTQKYKIPG